MTPDLQMMLWKYLQNDDYLRLFKSSRWVTQDVTLVL
jgi:hypothetical protein